MPAGAYITSVDTLNDRMKEDGGCFLPFLCGKHVTVNPNLSTVYIHLYVEVRSFKQTWQIRLSKRAHTHTHTFQDGSGSTCMLHNTQPIVRQQTRNPCSTKWPSGLLTRASISGRSCGEEHVPLEASAAFKRACTNCSNRVLIIEAAAHAPFFRAIFSLLVY